MNELLLQAKIIQNLENEAKVANVKRCLKLGELLTNLKSQIKQSTKARWIPFVENNIGLSLRLCQNYMHLYKHKDKITEKDYCLGTEMILKLLRS